MSSNCSSFGSCLGVFTTTTRSDEEGAEFGEGEREVTRTVPDSISSSPITIVGCPLRSLSDDGEGGIGAGAAISCNFSRRLGKGIRSSDEGILCLSLVCGGKYDEEDPRGGNGNL